MKYANNVLSNLNQIGKKKYVRDVICKMERNKGKVEVV